MNIDPITLELIAQGFIAIVREMRATMLKTAYSNVIKEGRDFSCALLDAEGQKLASFTQTYRLWRGSRVPFARRIRTP